MLKSGVAVAGTVLVFVGCQPKRSPDAQAAFVSGSWSAEPRSNLLLAVNERLPVRVCLDFAGPVDSARFQTDAKNFSTLVSSALREWLNLIGQSPQIETLLRPCSADVECGVLKVVLHYNEQMFQREISQTSSPTLGVYLVGAGALVLNVSGVTNPRRDPTGGRKTILHELGHAFGLHHSSAAGSVMQANLSQASSRLTNDDAQGIKSIWQRIQETKAQYPVGQAEISPKVTPSMPSEWAYVPPKDQVLSVSLRHDSWFKVSTAQSASLPEQQKCAVVQGQKVKVRILNNGQTEAAHLRVQLDEALSGCVFGAKGAVGFLYQPHLD